MKNRLIYAAAGALLCGLCTPAMAGFLETQTFDSEASAAAAGWTGNGLNRSTTLGTDFGFSNTNNAGAAAGEAGGLFPRLRSSTASYGDISLGRVFSLADPLSASGRIFVSNINFNGGIAIGWFDSADASFADFVGLNVSEPSAATAPNFRAGARAVLSDLSEPTGTSGFTISPNVAHQFVINYDPTGGAGGFGALTVSVGGNSSTLALTSAQRSADARLDAFGLITRGPGDNPNLLAQLFIDDVTYTSAAPEPSTFALLGMGAVGLLGFRRRRRRCVDSSMRSSS